MRTVVTEAMRARVRQLIEQGLTHAAVGDRVGISRRAVWQIITEAATKAAATSYTEGPGGPDDAPPRP